MYMKIWQSDFEGQQKSHIKLVIFEGVFVWLLFFVALFFLLSIYTHISLFHKNKFNICPLWAKICCWITNVWITFICLYICDYFYCNREFPSNIFWESYKSCLSFTNKRISYFHEGSLLGGDIYGPVLEHCEAQCIASSILSSGKR